MEECALQRRVHTHMEQDNKMEVHAYIIVDLGLDAF